MEKLLKYSILRYSPSTVSGEWINLGILFSEESLGLNVFNFSRNFARIKKFDDEIEKDVLFDFLQGIKNDVQTREDFNIDTFTKFYINNYAFSETCTVIYHELEKTMEDLNKLYFRFDYAKEQRSDKRADQKLLSQMIVSVGKKVLQNKKIEGYYDEKIVYDLVTDDFYIKIFDFDGKDLKKCINSAKAWAWNCNHERNKNILIVYRYSQKELIEDEFRIIKNIFEETPCHFCNVEESIQLLQTVS